MVGRSEDPIRHLDFTLDCRCEMARTVVADGRGRVGVARVCGRPATYFVWVWTATPQTCSCLVCEICLSWLQQRDRLASVIKL